MTRPELRASVFLSASVTGLSLSSAAILIVKCAFAPFTGGFPKPMTRAFACSESGIGWPMLFGTMYAAGPGSKLDRTKLIRSWMNRDSLPNEEALPSEVCRDMLLSRGDAFGDRNPPRRGAPGCD
eukprot:2296133-Prymnesium_polylepis.1